MKIYNKTTVLEEAKTRINWLFDEFETVVVGMSGGKDSTVCLQLCLEIARERNRLPLKVMWIDQEAEWQGTADYCEEVFSRPEVEPMWFQIPMTWYNNVSSFQGMIKIWDEDDKENWIRPKSETSIKDNIYLKFGFQELFENILKHHFPNQKACYIAGVRAEESPRRKLAMTRDVTYKGVTWGKRLYKPFEQYSFYPIYDWSYTDVWKYIHENGFKYNRVYDEMYQHGASIHEMRISNLHHETAIQSLLLVQEIEPKTWNKISSRIDGANAIKHLETDAFRCPTVLPYMFSSWEEYAEHLIENIIQEDKYKKLINNKVDKLKLIYTDHEIREEFFKTIIKTVLSSDWDLTKLKNWTEGNKDAYIYREYKKGNVKDYMLKDSKFVTDEMRQELKEKLIKQQNNE